MLSVHCLWNDVSIVKAVQCKDVQFRLQSLTVPFKFWPRFFNSIPIPIEMFLPLISIPIPILWTLKHPKSNSWIAHHWSSDAEADRPKMLHKSHNWAKNNTKPYRIYNDKGRLYWVRSSLHLKWVYTTYIKLHYTQLQVYHKYEKVMGTRRVLGDALTFTFFICNSQNNSGKTGLFKTLSWLW